MIRRVQLNLNNSTEFKKQKLDTFFDEYRRVVNEFISIFWNSNDISSKVNSKTYKQVNSWLLGKAMKCAGNQAIKIVKPLLKLNNNKIYKRYQKVFSKCKKRDRNIFGILSSKWSEWSVNRNFKCFTKIPEYKHDIIQLNSDLVRLQDTKNAKSFDSWLRIGSVFGNRYSLLLPTKKHKHFNKMVEQGFILKKSFELIRLNSGYYVNVYFEKKVESSKLKTKILGIDVGINKLLSLSDGRFLGKELNQLLEKLHRRKWGSVNFKQTTAEIRHYIGYCVNNIDIENYDCIVMEDLKNITKNTKGRVNKALRKKLGNWNIRELYSRISNKCELNRVWLNFVDSAYTSQTCSGCQVIDKSSRKGEVYKCKHCNLQIDADYNASLNILNRFSNKEFAVPYVHKKK